jgi:hypothetical protein
MNKFHYAICLIVIVLGSFWLLFNGITLLIYLHGVQQIY